MVREREANKKRAMTCECRSAELIPLQCVFSLSLTAVGNMRVVSGGALDVDLKVSQCRPHNRSHMPLHLSSAHSSLLCSLLQILDPRNKVVFEQTRRTEETFQFYAQEPGLYAFCFSNLMSVVSGKAVSFNIFVGHTLNQKDAAKQQHFSVLETSVTQLAQSQ